MSLTAICRRPCSSVPRSAMKPGQKIILCEKIVDHLARDLIGPQVDLQMMIACDDGRGTFAVRRHVPPVNRRHVRRLPVGLQAAHTDWVQAQLAEPPVERARRRARRLALMLLEQGDDVDRVEHSLRTAGFQPTVSHESARWAVAKHREALAAVEAEAEEITLPAA